MMTRWFAPALALLLAAPAWAGTPGQQVTLTAVGISPPLTLDANQGAPVTFIVHADAATSLSIESAMSLVGPWVTMSSFSLNAADNFLVDGVQDLVAAGSVFTLPVQPPYLRLHVTVIPSGSATLGISQPVTH